MNTHTSKTPETDAEAHYIHMSPNPEVSGYECVDADFARKLELQLNELLKIAKNQLSHEEDILKLLKVFAPSDSDENEFAGAEARIASIRAAIASVEGGQG